MAQAIQMLSSLVEEGIDISLRVKWNEVVNLLAGAHVTNRQIQFAGDSDDDSAFRRAVELGENDSGNARMVPEFASLVQAILSRGGVEDKKHIVRRAGNHFRRGAFHFFELGHEIRFGV